MPSRSNRAKPRLRAPPAADSQPRRDEPPVPTVPLSHSPSVSRPASPTGHGSPPVLVAEQRQLFQRVLGALNRGGVSCAVAGAFAFRHHTGIWRFTKDLDIFLPADKVPVALTLCRTVGLVTEITDPVWLAKAWAGDYYVDLISGMSNGVFWVTPDWIDRGQMGEILGQRTRLLAPEEMILSKIFVTRRDRFDASDICHLLYRTGARLDWEYLRREVGDHWEMLLWHLLLFRYVYPHAARTIVPSALWDELLARLDNGNPVPAPAFRGSLIDPLMFAVDVTAWGLENLEDGFRRRRMPPPPPPAAAPKRKLA